MNDDEDYINPSRGARWLLALLLLALAFVFVYVIDEIERLTSLEINSDLDVEQAIEGLLRLNEQMLAGSLFVGLLITGLVLRMALAARKTGCFPPPGTPVLVRTKIVRGNKARFRTMLCYLFLVLIWLPLAIPIYIGWLLQNL